MAARCETCDYHLERIVGQFVCLQCSHEKMQSIQAVLDRAGVQVRLGDKPGLVFGIPPEKDPPQTYWVTQLHAWMANGTFDRMNDCGDQPVRVRRNDGSLSIGVIHATAGFGGRQVEVMIETPGGPIYKDVGTDDFLELNPGFGPHLKELVPKQD